MSKLQELQRELASLTQNTNRLRKEQQDNISEATRLLSDYNSQLNALKNKHDKDAQKNSEEKRRIETELSDLERDIKKLEGDIDEEQTKEREEADRKHAQEAQDRANKK